MNTQPGEAAAQRPESGEGESSCLLPAKFMM